MKQSRNGYKLIKFVLKIFVDLFVYINTICRLTASFFTPADSRPQSLVTVIFLPERGMVTL